MRFCLHYSGPILKKLPSKSSSFMKYNIIYVLILLALTLLIILTSYKIGSNELTKETGKEEMTWSQKMQFWATSWIKWRDKDQNDKITTIDNSTATINFIYTSTVKVILGFSILLNMMLDNCSFMISWFGNSLMSMVSSWIPIVWVTFSTEVTKLFSFIKDLIIDIYQHGASIDNIRNTTNSRTALAGFILIFIFTATVIYLFATCLRKKLKQNPGTDSRKQTSKQNESQRLSIFNLFRKNLNKPRKSNKNGLEPTQAKRIPKGRLSISFSNLHERNPCWKLMLLLLWLFFFVSVPWEFVRLYQHEVAEKAALTFKGLPSECIPAEMTYLETLMSWFSSKISWDHNPCEKYHKAVLVDPLWEVTPLMVVSSAFTRCIAKPLEVLSATIGRCFRLIFTEIPAQWQPVLMVILTIVIIMTVIMCCGYKIHLPMFLNIEPSSRSSSTLHKIRKNADGTKQITYHETKSTSNSNDRDFQKKINASGDSNYSDSNINRRRPERTLDVSNRWDDSRCMDSSRCTSDGSYLYSESGDSIHYNSSSQDSDCLIVD